MTIPENTAPNQTTGKNRSRHKAFAPELDYAERGYLLYRRGEDTGDSADSDEAVRLLELAVAEDPDDWEEALSRRFDLARAYHAQWRLGRTTGSLHRAADGLDTLAAMPLPADDRLLAVHNERLQVGHELVEEEEREAPGAAPPSAARFVEYVAAAGEAWDRTAGTPSELRTMSAALLATATLYAGAFDPDAVELDRLGRLVAVARSVADPPAEWDQLLDLTEVIIGYAEAAERPTGPLDGGMERLVSAGNADSRSEETELLLGRLTPLLLEGQAVRSGDRRMGWAAKAGFDGGADTDADFALLGSLLAVQDQVQRGDSAGIREQIERMAALAGERAPSYTARQTLLPLLEAMRQTVDGASGGALPVDRTPVTGTGGVGSQLRLATALLGVGGPLVAAARRHDLPALRECADRVTELAGHAPPDHIVRLLAAVMGAQAELEVARHDPADRSAAQRAVTWAAEATALAGGPHHPLWAQIALHHAEALRLAGHPDRTRSRRYGLDALRGHAWQVLLQSGTDDALVVGAKAAADALRVAAWCGEDGALADLLTALEAGRGLMLHAATTSRRVPEQLRDAGRPELAREWESSAGVGRDAMTGQPLNLLAAGPEVPDELRVRVLHALGADDATVFGGVTVGDVQSALTTLGADALVYLIPPSDGGPGTAFVVPASGTADSIPLPDLVTGPASPIGRHAGSHPHRDAGPVGAADGTAERPSVDELCQWAWSAAIGPLLRYARRWCLGRPARLVLVPVGMLALVPWHGAYRRDATGRHYAVEHAVFSYTVSARTLCATARLPIRPIRSALIVGDPGGDLPFAGEEARAIRDVFYPGAAYLGSTDGTGTPEQVLDWIARTGSGSSLLHFACHGRTDPGNPLDAHLVLAGGVLTARRLLDASRLAELAIDRVFLGACTTALSGTAYDEAFSLSTAFLAAGAGTVFGSLWPVPDAETSLLMYLVHHHVNAESCAPVDALHRAQLWMLDERRRPPAGMPPELARRCGDERVADPLSWAAFTHLGR